MAAHHYNQRVPRTAAAWCCLICLLLVARADSADDMIDRVIVKNVNGKLSEVTRLIQIPHDKVQIERADEGLTVTISTPAAKQASYRITFHPQTPDVPRP